MDKSQQLKFLKIDRNLVSISKRAIDRFINFIREKVFKLLRGKKAPPKPVLNRCASLPSSRWVKRRERCASQGDFKDFTELLSPDEGFEEMRGEEADDSDEECEDSLSLIQQMSSFDVKSEHNPLPEHIIKEIDRMCVENCIDDAVWYQSSKDWQRVIVQGSGVTKALEQLEPDAKRLTPFTFVFVDSGPLHTEQCGDWSVINERLCEGGHMTISAACGMLLCEKQRSPHETLQSPDDRGNLHVLTAAHLVLTQSECLKLLRHHHPAPIDDIRKEIESQGSTYKYALTCRNHNNNNYNYSNLTPPPRFCYRHWFQNSQMGEGGKWKCSAKKCLLKDCEEDCHHKYLNDVAMIFLDSKEIENFKLQKTHLLHVLFDKILPFKHADIEKMIVAERQPEIFVGTRVTPYVLRDSCHPPPSYSRAYAYHIAFRKNPAKDYQRELVEGDSGSVVYVKSGEQRWALGIFIGKYKGEVEAGETVYQAILLHQALKDLKQDYNTGKLVLPRRGVLTSPSAEGATAS